VFGSLKKGIAASTSSKTFEIGDASYYTPVTVTFTGATNSVGSLTVNTTATEHPSVNTSGIDPSQDVNRYWSITNTGVTGFTSYALTHIAANNLQSLDIKKSLL
jgi:hypothetical protein